MSSLDCPRPRLRLVLVVGRDVAVDLDLVLVSRVARPRERGRSLLLRRLPATAEVPALMTRMMLHLLLAVPPVAVVVVVLLVALAQEEVLQEVLLRLELHRPGSARARLHLHGDQHLDVPALLVDGLLDGVPGAQVVVALPVHCLGVVFLPIGIRRVLRYDQCGSVVLEGPCYIRGRSTPVQSLLVVRLSTGSLVAVCAHVCMYLLASCSLCRSL